MILGDDVSSFWANTEKGGPALIGVVITSVLVFVFVKYLIWPIVQLIAQTATDMRLAAETHRECQREYREGLVTMRRLADEGKQLIVEGREILEPLKPKSRPHAKESAEC